MPVSQKVKTLLTVSLTSDMHAQQERVAWCKRLQNQGVNLLLQNDLLPQNFEPLDVHNLLRACAQNTTATVTESDVAGAIRGKLPGYALQALSAHLTASNRSAV